MLFPDPAIWNGLTLLDGIAAGVMLGAIAWAGRLSHTLKVDPTLVWLLMLPAVMLYAVPRRPPLFQGAIGLLAVALPLGIGLLILPWMGFMVKDEVRWSVFQSLVTALPYGLVVVRVVQQNPHWLYSLVVAVPGALMVVAAMAACLDYALMLLKTQFPAK